MGVTEAGLPGQCLLAVRVCNPDSAACCQELGPWWQKAQRSAATLIVPTGKDPEAGSGPTLGDVLGNSCLTCLPSKDPSEGAQHPFSLHMCLRASPRVSQPSCHPTSVSLIRPQGPKPTLVALTHFAFLRLELQKADVTVPHPHPQNPEPKEILRRNTHTRPSLPPTQVPQICEDLERHVE